MRNNLLRISGVLCCMIALPAGAQQSGFQSANGQTSIYLGSGSAATFNSSDTKFSIGSQFHHSDKPLFLGYEVFAKASTGATTLFSSKIKVPEGGADFFIGWQKEGSRPNSKQWFLFDLGYSRSAFYVADTAVPIDKAKRYFDRYRTIAAYNNRPNGWFLVGIAAGAERRNNLDDLKQISFETTVVPAASGSVNSVVKTQAGYLGNYREYVAAPIYTDLLFILPKAISVPGIGSRIAIDAFTRSDIAAPNRYADGGVGIFATKKGSPTKVIGGIAASWNGGKAKVALVASYTF